MGVDVEVELLQMLEQDPALSLDDRLRQPGGAGGVEDPERVVEGDAVELERRFALEVPVVEIEGEIVAQGQVDVDRVRAAVNAARIASMRRAATGEA